MARRLPNPTRGAIILLVAVALFCGACSGDNDDPAGDGVDDPAAAAAAALDGRVDPTAGDETPDATEAEPVQLDPTEIAGELIDQFTLEVGDCFDRLEDLRSGRPVIITTRLACDEPHHFQVFALLAYPAEHPSLYPGDDVMVDFALRSCYQQFADWVGTQYELSVLEIGLLTPNRANFEDSRARYRGIHCWVEHVDGEPLQESMRGSGI